MLLENFAVPQHKQRCKRPLGAERGRTFQPDASRFAAPAFAESFTKSHIPPT